MLSDLGELPAIKLTDTDYLRFEVGTISSFGHEVAAKELRETPEVKKKAMEELRNMLKQDTDLHMPIENDDWIIRFLRPCKFYPDSARKLIRNYYQFKEKHKDIYQDLIPSNEPNIFKQNILVVVPNRDQLGRRILLLELGKRWKHKEVSLDEVFKGCVIFLEAATLEPETQIHGAVVIFDMNGLSLQQTWQFTPQFAKRIVDWLQDSVPMRIKAIHIVNQPKIFQLVFQLFKPFLREKLRNRIYFHGSDMNSLHKHISEKYLPPVYGGTSQIPRVDGDKWYDMLSECDSEYKAINSYGLKKNIEAKK